MPIHHTENDKLVSSRRNAFDFESATFQIGAVVPTGDVVIQAIVNVTAAFDGTAPALEVGIAADKDAVLIPSQVDLKTVGTTHVDVWYPATAEVQLQGDLTPDGSTAGAATIILIVAPG